MPGWSLEELSEACGFDPFWQSVEAVMDTHDAEDLAECSSEEEKREMMLHAKYYLGGHSSRWVFGYSSDSIRKSLDGVLRRVTDFRAEIAGVVGQGSPSAVNTLWTEMDSRVVPVSLYAWRVLALRSPTAAMATLTNLAKTAGGAFDGIVLELDFVAQLRVAQVQPEGKGSLTLDQVQPLPQVAPRVELRPERILEFYNPSDLKSNLPLQRGDVLRCVKENQGCYDVVYVSSCDQQQQLRLQFFQITIRDRHPLKLKHIAPLLEELKPLHAIEALALDIVVPRGQGASFRRDLCMVSSPSTLRPWWSREQLRVFEFLRSA